MAQLGILCNDCRQSVIHFNHFKTKKNVLIITLEIFLMIEIVVLISQIITQKKKLMMMKNSHTIHAYRQKSRTTTATLFFTQVTLKRNFFFRAYYFLHISALDSHFNALFHFKCLRLTLMMQLHPFTFFQTLSTIHLN